VKVFASSLHLEKEYFGNRTTYPGADGLFNSYPPTTKEEERKNKAVELGSHTSLQLFTLLCQDTNVGL
jgi:isopenicillin N synthase-like dioxygenase